MNKTVKKKKTIASVIIVFSIALTLVGCGSLDKPLDNQEQASVVVDPGAYSNIVNSEENKELVSENDPLAVLRVTEEFAKENGLLILKRNDKLYSLGDIYSENCKKYNLGWFFFPTLNLNAVNKNAVGPAKVRHDLGDGLYMTAGDFPEIILEDGDELLTYRDSDQIYVFSCEIVGYSPEIREIDLDGGSYEIVNYEDKKECPIVYKIENWKEFSLIDKNGNVVTTDLDMIKLRNLKKGEEYKFHYIDGFDEYEWSVKADCTVYKAEDPLNFNIEPAYVLQGSIDTVNKCYTFDHSKMQSGLYSFGGCIVTVK